MSDLKLLFISHLSLCTTDFAAWLELIHDDIVLEFPYAQSVGNPTVIRGKPAVAEGVKLFFEEVPALRFVRPLVYETREQNQGFATYEADTIVPATGRRYAQNYIAQFTATDGRLSLIREYYDPKVLADAFTLPGPT